MAIPITVPRLDWSMEEGTFGGWLKQEGEQVKPGDPLFILESEKATEEIQALDGGILRIPNEAAKGGATVKVGQVLAYLVAEGETAPMIGSQLEAKALVSGNQDTSAKAPSISQTTIKGKEKAISPRARRLARELGIDWSVLKGSGKTGRIRERDIRAASQSLAEGRLIPPSHMRRTIAARMLAGVTQAAPVTLTIKADAGNLVNLRRQFKTAAADGQAVPSYTDMVVKLTAAALRRHPLLQAQWRDDGLFIPEHIDIALAVDTDAGLLVPVIRQADRLTLREIAGQALDLIARARAGELAAEHMRGATFTITNLGHLGIDAFTPIIHLPQCAVLGIGRIAREPVVLGDQIVPRDMVTLSLTFDHRSVDGAPAARFLNTLRQNLENPAPWLIP